MADGAPAIELPKTREKNTFVLCFDGTGNKFSGTDADSNILKLYRMLDRTNPNVYTFYQPGIGTYITSHSMQTTSMVGRMRSAYLKAKDSAVGSSFAEHVMGGYKFLMRYYSCEDDLYFFGFSRGAYTARFLAEMLDHIGLLSAGNEELQRFAWKTYAKWAARKNDGSKKAKEEEETLYEFMRGFRETFSRPVRRIRFMGLFDTVNSVPRFENAWMQRSKFPYTARSSAKVIRHAVSIDERRAKFRQDLLGESRDEEQGTRVHPAIHRYNSDLATMAGLKSHLSHKTHQTKPKAPQIIAPINEDVREDRADREDDDFHSVSEKADHLGPPPTGLSTKHSDASIAAPNLTPSLEHLRNGGVLAHDPTKPYRRRWSDQIREQDIEEVWFAGGHADIGGGWARTEDKETWMLSHIPLVWMVQEADKAGLQFDPIKVSNANCIADRVDNYGLKSADPEVEAGFLSSLEAAYKTGLIHDCLCSGQGSPSGTVMMWKVMEYLPFRRMDLQKDGSWKAIRWPLPMGETRDIPDDAQIHHSVIKRMMAAPHYRPGNLIIGGGGRGVRHAPKKYGIGQWDVCKFENDPVRETFRRPARKEQEHHSFFHHSHSHQRTTDSNSAKPSNTPTNNGAHS